MNNYQQENQHVLSISGLKGIIEQIQQAPDIQLIRVFPFYFPVWAVEIEARQKSRENYWLIDKYIERGIWQADLHTTQELAAFLGIEQRLVEKAVNLLSAIGHIREADGQFHLTPLGVESHNDQRKYTMLETRRLLYVERFFAQPLLTEHYNSKNMQFLPGEVLPDHHKGQKFHYLYSPKRWDGSVLTKLEKNEKRMLYNIPDEVIDLKFLDCDDLYTPVYIFETTKRTRPVPEELWYLVYTGLQDMRDLFFEGIVNASPEIRVQLQGYEKEDLARLWTRHVSERNVSVKHLSQQADGSWQLLLLADDLQSPKSRKAFGDLGQYWTQKGYFLRVWCDDENIRWDAALDQVLDFIERKRQITPDELDKYLLFRKNILHIQYPSREDVLRRAKEQEREKALEALLRILKM